MKHDHNIIIYIIASLIVFSFLQFLPEATGTVVDPDTFYHLKITELISQNGIIQDFPWLQFTTWNGNFIDHHLLFHVILIPFTFFNPFIGIKIETILSATAFVVIFSLILRKLKVKWQWLWVSFLLLGSVSFLFRISLGRAQNISLIILFLGIYLFLGKPTPRKYFTLFALSFLYVWSYGGFILLPAIGSLVNFVDWLKIKKINSFKPFFISSAGIISGLVLNPYFPKSLGFLKIQMFQIPFTADIVKKGMEWNSILLYWQDTLRDNFLVLLLFILSVLLLARKIFVLSTRRLKIPLNSPFSKEEIINIFREYQLLLIASLFLLLTLKSQRFIEYFIPSALLFTAYSLSNDPITTRLVRKIQIFFRANKDQLSHSLNKDRPKNNFFPRLIIISCFALISISLALYTLITTSWYLGRGWKNDEYERAAKWLSKNTPQGSIIFNMDWDNFPELFYYNTHNYYIVGMDPTFMYEYDKELYWTWYHITVDWSLCNKEDCAEKNSEGVTAAIKNKFHAKYIFIEKTSQVEKILSRQLEKAFEDKTVVIYEL